MKTIPTKIKQILTLITATVALLGAMNCRATTYTFNVASGVWNVAANWTPSTGYPGSADTAIIPTGDIVTGLGGASQACTTLTIQGTGSLTVDANTLAVSGTATVGTSGIATLTVASGATLTVGTLDFGDTTSTVMNNGTMSFGGTGGSAGTLTQGTGANLTDSQANGGAPSFNITATALGNTVTYSGSGPAVKVANYQNLTFTSTTSSSYSWSSSIIVNGTLTTSGTALNNFQGTFGAITLNGGNITGNGAITVNGNLTITSGTFYPQTSGAFTVSGTTTINGGTLEMDNTTSGATFTGNFILSSGTFNSSYSGQNPAVTFGGSLTVNGGTFTSGTGMNTFNGLGQTISGTIAIPKVTVNGNHTISSGTLTVSTALVLTSGTVSSANNLTLAAGATIIVTMGSLSGTPTFGTTVNVTYNGASVTTTGPEIPTSTSVLNNLTNNDAAGVILNTSTTVNGTLALTSGTLSIGANTLTLNGTVSIGSGTLTGGTTSLITCGGTSAKTLPAVASGLETLTDTDSGTVTIGGSITLDGSTALVLTSGTVSSANNLTLATGATITRAAGSLSGTPTFGTTVNVTYNGASATTGTELPASSSVLNNLTINNSGTVTLGGSATVNGTLTLTSGAFSIGANTLALNGAISTDSGTLTGGTSSLITCGGTSSITLPGVTSGLKTLTVNNIGGVTIGGAITLNGSTALVLTSGTVSSANNLTLAAGATIIVTAGSLSGTPTFGITVNVTYNGATAITTGPEIPTSTSVLNNLTNSDAAGVTLSSSTTVNGMLALTSGTFAVGANMLTLNGPTIAGTPANLSTTSSSTLVFGGSSASVAVPSSVTALNGLTINNASGVTLNSNPTVSGTLTLTSGRLITGANTLTVTSAGTIVGGSSSSYVYGNLDCGLITSRTSAVFPVGDSSVYAPVSLTSATVTSAGDLIVSTVANQNSQRAFNSSGLSQTQYIKRDWTISAANGYAESAGSITLNFVAGDMQGGMNTTADYVGKYSGGTWTRPTVANRTTTSITVCGIASFSDWVIGDLPIPSFSGLISPTITYGTSSVSLSGTLSANSGTAFPVNGSTVTASINGNAVSGTVMDSTGDFTINYNDPSLATDGVGSSPYTITYLFAGDANLTAAASNTSTSLAVTQATPVVTVIVDSYIYNGSPQGPTAVTTSPTSTGAVTWSYAGVGSTSYGPVSTLPTLAGSYTATATVAADANNNSASSSATAFSINQETNAISLTSSVNPSTYGQSVIFMAAVQTNGVTAEDATSNIVFVVDNVPVATNAIASGLTTYTNCMLLVGGHSILAEYTGDNNYLASTNSPALIQTVNPATPSATGGTLSGSGFLVTFAGPSGQTYQVLTSTNLALPIGSWYQVASGVFTGSTMNYTNAAPTDAQRFYIITSP